MKNSFFTNCCTSEAKETRLKNLLFSKIGIFSIGPYAASLAYNSVMHSDAGNILLANRPNRDVTGSFSEETINNMDQIHLDSLRKLCFHTVGKNYIPNTLSYLIEKCETRHYC